MDPHETDALPAVSHGSEDCFITVHGSGAGQSFLQPLSGRAHWHGLVTIRNLTSDACGGAPGVIPDQADKSKER
jgi:hypothetical protein